MALTPGQALSHYEILGPLGAGGMGEVYRAKDTQLDREVAIKVLPEHFAEDEERLRRFEREAKTLASLNHPNVAAIYGVDQVGDVCLLALELVPGEDLSARLVRGALGLDEAVDVCRQIAEGLESAHGAGVVHRDLKPANVRVTPEGKVKLLDFGLAKGTQPMGTSDGLSTEVGQILGTPAYMSPEQVSGKPVDRRTDVWAFGCILFELLSGRRAFEAEGLADLMVAIAGREPDWARLPRETPASLRRLLERCLTKDPRARLQAVGEARIVLENPMQFEPEANATARRSLPWFAVAALGLLALIAGYLFGIRGQQTPQILTVRLGVELPPGLRLDLPNPRSGGLSGIAAPLAISADGTTLVYNAKEGEGVSGLYLRRLDSFEARLLEGTENAEAPFFSPDGLWVGFFGEAGLYKAPVEGGSAPRMICPLALIDRPSATWGDNQTIFFSRGINAEGRLESVPDSGGEPTTLTALDFAAGDSWHGLPQLLPGGETVLFTVASRAGSGARAALLDLETKEHRLIEGTGEAAGARFLEPDGSRPGLLLYSQGGRLLAVEYDLDEGSIRGIPWKVIDQVSSSALGVGHWTCSENGALAYISGNVPEAELVLVDRQGATVWQSPEVGVYQHPRISLDGDQLLFDWIKSGGRDIWVYDLRRDVPRRLTFEYQNMDPIWAPDGERVVFSRFVENVRTLHLLDTGQVGQAPTLLLEGTGYNQIPGSWSSDGQLLFTAFGSEKEDLWVLPSLEGRAAKPVLAGAGRQGFGVIRPEGDGFLAYTSDKSGVLEVYVCSYPEFGDEQRVTYGGGSEPLWSRDGKELFFRKGLDFDEFFAAPVSVNGGEIEVGEPTRLFVGPYDCSPSGHQHYDVAEDGQRFALVRTLGNEIQSELRVMLHWWSENRPAGSESR